MDTTILMMKQAYGVIGNIDRLSDTARVDLVRTFTRAIGSEGLVGGQVIDLKERSGTMDPRRIEKLNELKTAALFVAAVETGAIIAGAKGASFEAARVFATKLGLAFQIADDLLDDPAYAGQTGKDTGKDRDKPTVVSVLGRDQARQVLEQYLTEARQSLTQMSATPSPLTVFFEASFAQISRPRQG